MVRRMTAVLGALAVLAAAGCSHRPGTAENPLKLWVVPSEPGESSTAAARSVAALLGQKTGLVLEAKVPGCYGDLVAGLGTGAADVAFMNDMAYLLARERFGATATLAVVRASGAQSYKGAILVRADSGLSVPADLSGKRVAYVDVFSVAGYIMPAVLLKSQGVKPATVVKAGTHDAVVRMVYEKRADAGFSYLNPGTAEDERAHDAREHLAREYPDIDQVLTVLAATEDIPNEPVVFRKDLPAELRRQVEEGLLAIAGTDEGRAALLSLHAIAGFRRVDDAAYEPIRQALVGLGQKLDDAVPGGGLLDLAPNPPIPPLGS